MSRFNRAALGLGSDAIKWIGATASGIDKLLGTEPNKKTEDYAAYKLGKQLEEFIQDTYPTNESMDSDYMSSLASGMGSIAGFAISGPTRTLWLGAAAQSVPEY